MTNPGEHIASYYAATAHRAPARLALAGDISAEICIIGGGFSGVSTALSLAERGHDVVVLEANRIGWGASGRNGGQVLPGWSGEGEMVKQLGARAQDFLRGTRYCGNEIIEDRIEKYSINCDYVRGAATLALNIRQMDALKAEYAEAGSGGMGGHFELVDGAGLKNHVASEIYCGGLIDRRAAHCHPLNLCLGEARACESLGVRIYEQTKVDGILHGENPVVSTAGGKVTARIVILAGNAYHKLEQETLGGYMLPAQTFTIATEVIGENRARAVLPDNIGVCDANWALDYFRRSADHRILFGGLCTYSNRVIADIEGALTPRLLQIFPQLEGVRAEFAWGGAIGIPLNRVPLIGRSGENVFYAQGYSGHGVNCSHIAGEMLADAVEANFEGVDLFEAVRHFRIPAAPLIGNPMLALGMTWFRMRDALGV
jgi:glycine/D-amino acid oxidase-like deaminating enzyme